MNKRNNSLSTPYADNTCHIDSKKNINNFFFLNYSKKKEKKGILLVSSVCAAVLYGFPSPKDKAGYHIFLSIVCVFTENCNTAKYVL